MEGRHQLELAPAAETLSGMAQDRMSDVLP